MLKHNTSQFADIKNSNQIVQKYYLEYLKVRI